MDKYNWFRIYILAYLICLAFFGLALYGHLNSRIGELERDYADMMLKNQIMLDFVNVRGSIQ